MWERKILFRFLLSRAHSEKKSRMTPQIDRKDSNSDIDDNRRLEKQNSKKKRKVPGSENVVDVTKKKKFVGEDDVSIDRISELPESIIHHIFSYLRCTKDVVRTTVLSKNWKSMFDSYQSFDFDQRWFRMREEENEPIGITKQEAQRYKFIEYVDKTVATRLARVECVNKLRVYADDANLLVIIRCLLAFDAAKAKNVKEVDLQFSGERITAVPISLDLCDSVTFLKLSACRLQISTFMKNFCLRAISLKNSKFVDVATLKNIEEKFPLLEDLRLVNCPRLLRIEISSLPKLRRLEVQDCAKVSCIKIASSNLETFWYHAKYLQECKIDLRGSENLRNLTLKDSMMSDSAFEGYISLCSSLEKLVLHSCDSIKKLTICSPTLKSLTLIQFMSLKVFDIDAPYLYSFQYDGQVTPFPFLRSCSRLSETKVSFKSYPWRQKFQFEKYFGNFDGKGIRLIVYTKQNMKIFEEPREAGLFQLKKCKIELTGLSLKLVETVENWLKGCHGDNIMVVSSSGELIKLVKKLVIDKEDNPSCCRFYKNKCWRHHIADVKVSTLDTMDKTSFDLTWKPRKTSEGQVLHDN